MGDDKLIEEIRKTIGEDRGMEYVLSADEAKEIISLVRESEWISVDDELPEEEVNVLASVLMTDGSFSQPDVNWTFRKAGYPNQGDLIWTCGLPDYWKPLPSPPSAKADK